MKRFYVFAGFLVLVALIGYPFLRELKHVSDVKQSKKDFQQVVDRDNGPDGTVRRSSRAWNTLPSNLRDRLRSLGFFPASLQDNRMGFTLKRLNGQRTSLEDTFDRWVLLNFWATWCPPCRMEMPSLDQLQDRFPDRLRVLTINVEQTPGTIRRFRNNYDFDLPVLLDSSGAVARRYGVTGLPESWIIAPGGQPLAKLNGPLEWHNPPASTTFETLIDTDVNN